MALTAGVPDPVRRGPAVSGAFGYLVAAGEKIWRGGLVAVNSSGQLQRIQTAGSVAFVGMATQDYDNSASASASADYVVAEKGTYRLAVSGASYANIGQNVYASDDNTLSLANALSGVYARGGSDTGTGTVGTITAAAGAKVGVYTGTVKSGATTFSLVDPNGDALPDGTIGSAYASGGLGFTLSNSGTSFIAGDTFTITVSESAGAMLVGTLAGIENSNTYVKLQG